MAKYEKKEVTINLEQLDLEYDLDKTIKHLLNLKKEYKKTGYFRFFIEKDTEYGYHEESYTHHYLYGVRLETDEEFYKRTEQHKKASIAAKKAAVTKEEKRKARELKIYKKLHKKYKGKV